MSILVNFTISTDRFELGDFIGRHEGLQGELERIVPTGDHAIPYVWVTGMPDRLDSLTERFEASDKTERVRVLDELTVSNSERRQRLYRIEWVLEDLDIIKGIITAGGAILEGESADHTWYLKFRFEDHQNVAEFYQYLADNEITDFQINSILELEDRADRRSASLSPEQREALTIAAQIGYFDLPRDGSLEMVSDQLDISQQAVSERVRRGVRNLVFDEFNLPHRNAN